MSAFLDTNAKILITGAGGMLGSSLCAELRNSGHSQVLAPRRNELDLLDGAAVDAYFSRHKPDVVFHLAATVFGLGGNLKNQFFSLKTNTVLNHNVLTACAATPAKKVFFAGTVASYPFPYQSLPLREELLLKGQPHYGEFGYAQAKLHALTYLTIMEKELGIPFSYGLLTNLFGPNDHFDVENGHVVPALIYKLHKAVTSGETFAVWGDGSARRDFLHVDDAARAIIAAVSSTSGVINISSGESVTIRQVVTDLCVAAKYSGKIVWQSDKPTGIPERSVANDRLEKLGFKRRFSLASGLKDAYDGYVAGLAGKRRA